MKKSLLFLLLTIVSFMVIGQEVEKQVIHSPEAPKAVGSFSQAILAGNTLYVSGQLPIDPATGLMENISGIHHLPGKPFR